MNRGLLDDRILFPGPILAGYAKYILERRMKHITIHGLMSRGCDNVTVLASDRDWTLQLAVRFRRPEDGIIVLTSVHRRYRIKSTCVGAMNDDSRVFFEQDAASRIILKASQEAYRGYWDTGLADSLWNRPYVERQKEIVEQNIDRLGLRDSFVGVSRDGVGVSILALPDFAVHPQKLKALSLPRAA